MRTIILLLLLLPCVPLSPSVSSVKVLITGLQSNTGKVVINVFNDKKGFPANPQYSFKQFSRSISNLKVDLEISDLPQGEYAICAYHDENNNGKLDLNFFNIPTEKTGCINNPKVIMMPSYDGAKFQLGNNPSRKQ